MYYLVIGGGGSGGTGGGNGFGDEPNGGGGGAGSVVGNTTLNLTGSSTLQSYNFTVGAPGAGVAGVTAGYNVRKGGNSGKDGNIWFLGLSLLFCI